MMQETVAWGDNKSILDLLVVKGFLRASDKKSWMAASIFTDYWYETADILGASDFPKPQTDKQYLNAREKPTKAKACANYLLWRKCVDSCLEETLPNVRTINYKCTNHSLLMPYSR
jgi:hypothetical protein